jgi:hypothetical protein
VALFTHSKCARAVRHRTGHVCSCVCLCVCVRARVCVFMCVCLRACERISVQFVSSSRCPAFQATLENAPTEAPEQSSGMLEKKWTAVVRLQKKVGPTRTHV